jgi:hypothetical protein
VNHHFLNAVEALVELAARRWLLVWQPKFHGLLSQQGFWGRTHAGN